MVQNHLSTCNAGYIPDDHWTQDIKQGGGRLLGEACHFVDLLRFLVGSSISIFLWVLLIQNPALIHLLLT